MESNKWEYRENFHSTGCGDYDGQYEITDGSIFICTTDDPDDITEKENSLQQIARLLNESGCKFYSNNALEIKQHIEILELGYRIDELQAKCDRYEELLQAVHQKAKEGIFPHLPVETMGAQKCVEIDAVLNEALSAVEGKKHENAKEGIIRLLLSNAAEISKDADTAKAYLQSEGVDVVKLEDDAKFVAWLAELSKLLHEASSGQPVKINTQEARKWYNDGFTAYQCFRETWDME